MSTISVDPEGAQVVTSQPDLDPRVWRARDRTINARFSLSFSSEFLFFTTSALIQSEEVLSKASI